MSHQLPGHGGSANGAGPSRPRGEPSSTPAPAETSTLEELEETVVDAARKAKTAIKKQISNSRSNQRPSVRILREPSSSAVPQSRPARRDHGLRRIQEQSDSRDDGPSNPSYLSRLSAAFHKRGRDEEANAGADDADEKPSRRRKLMVSKNVAKKLAPHMSPHSDAHGGAHNLAEHFAAHAEAYDPDEDHDSNAVRRAGRKASRKIKGIFGHEDTGSAPAVLISEEDEYNNDMVDLLDVVDPEVSTLSTLTNVQNSLFIPSLGNLLNRRPAYKLTRQADDSRLVAKLKTPFNDRPQPITEEKEPTENDPRRPQLTHSKTIDSTLSDSRYAVLPHGESLEGWTAEEKEMLNDLVRHNLHSRRAKIKRSLKGFGQYVRRPLGLFVTVYAALITIFGAAWVLFLIGWISLGSKRDYVINVVDNVLVALFAIIGDGLAPFRAVDTYHMIYIAHYYHKTWAIRKKLGLPELQDHNDLPDQQKENIDPEADVESLAAARESRAGSTNGSIMAGGPGEYSVLTEAQQAKLEHHERKFSKSHTFYKPHETATHYAFPLRLLVAIVVLLDCHSLLQITLGACTWGIPYKSRPFALTTVILCCSITCNIMGGVLISIGDHRTRKKEVIERMMRQELTAEAKEQIEKKKLKELEERGAIDKSVRKEAEEAREEAENEELKRQWKSVPLLPKKLLGKGEDHREPPLPSKSRSKSRKSSAKSESKTSQPSDHISRTDMQTQAAAGPSSGSGAMPGAGGATFAPTIVEAPELTPHQQALESVNAENRTSRRGRIMKVIRRADMDMS